ncbi:hydrogenase 4 subunit F [Azospirillum thiophilum]|uniref:Hydrogenase 4 subunit F n=1 Tax=Azospirillum thiophilum TaxID=528244 RepID=A0AAC9EY19_9PROT|nr:hydrogenase 4 subunit F [Azospirillum thiophilum]ALG73344.1 hydrogenase 4 subunit F [Azospirillum thiophilum]KJR63264.1 hydrogenase 4 subunit F [Azospirillum thiophilum]
MTPFLPAVLLIPLLSAVALALVPDWRLAAKLNAGASALTLLAALALFGAPPAATAHLVLDAFNVALIALTAFVGLTTAVFSAGYIGHEVRRGLLTPQKLRFYHAMFQAFLFTMLLALSANNLGVLWVAVEAATLTTVLMVSLYRTAASIEAAWKYFILCGVGIALALFGTILIYMAAQPVMGPGLPAMTWTALQETATRIDPNLLNLAFVFLLIGYGTKVGLAPLHAWLPDAHAEGPTPISAVLSGLLLNVALYAVLRFKMLLAANGAAMAPGPLMVTMGLASLLLAGPMLYRRRDVKRFFAYSSIEHMGIVTIAFGLGGPMANFAGLLHMAMHSLTKSAIFFAVGHAVQVTGTQSLAGIRGLTVSHPALGWGLLAGVVAIAGLPPFGVFMSEFLLVTSSVTEQPALAAALVVGILVAFGALVLRVQQLCFGAPVAEPAPLHGTLVPLYAHLALVLTAGLWIPAPLVGWFRSVAALLG